jgi:hypothetical protein
LLELFWPFLQTIVYKCCFLLRMAYRGQSNLKHRPKMRQNSILKKGRGFQAYAKPSPLQCVRIFCPTSTSTVTKRMLMDMVRSVLILALALAVPISVRQAQADQGPLERTGRTIKHSAEATGRTLKHGAEATGRTVGKGVQKTGQTLDHMGERISSR